MLALERLYLLFKLGLLLLFCFGIGGWLLFDGVAGKQRVTFDDVWPGIAAILAGFVVIGLLLYIRRALPDDERPAAAQADAPERTADAPTAPVPPAKWNEITHARRHLVVVGAVAFLMIGGCLLQARRAGNKFRNALAPPLPPEDAATNRKIMEQLTTADELARIEQLLDAGDKFVQSGEAAAEDFDLLDEKDRAELREATEKVAATLRTVRTRLDALPDGAANRDRLAGLRVRYSDLLERTNRIRAKCAPPNEK